MAFFNYLMGISQTIFFIVAGIIGLGILIGFHELGHFLFCKLFKIRTPSFSIGFGPHLISKKIGETQFVLSAIPFGGYVEIAGAAEIGQGEQKEAYSQDKYSFAQKPYYQKLLVMLGGIIFNLILAYVFIISLFFMGIPKSDLLYPLNAVPTIAEIETGSPAEFHGLQKGDIILSINGTPVQNNVETVISLIRPLADQKATIQIKRKDTELTKDIVVGKKDFLGTEVGSLGITKFETMELPKQTLLSAIFQGIQLTNSYIVKTIQGFLSLFKYRNVKAMAGPLMIVSMTAQGAAAGIKIFMILLAIISINLAILNLLPLPILDGGQILFYTLEALFGRPLPLKVKEYIHIISWVLIIALALYLSFNDIKRILYLFMHKS